MRTLLFGLTIACLFPLGTPIILAQVVAGDGDVELRVNVDRQSAMVAETIELSFRLTTPQGSEVAVPVLAETLGPFNVLNSRLVEDIPASSNPRVREWKLNVSLESLRSGKLTIPPLEFQYRLPLAGSEFQRILSEPVAIQINSMLEDPTNPGDLRAIKPPIDLAVPSGTSFAWVWWSAGGIGLIFLVAGVYTVLMHQRREPPPKDWAMGEIERIERAFDNSILDHPTAHQELATVLREFIEKQLEFSTAALSTGRLMAELQRRDTTQPTQEHLKQVLETADEVKFALLDREAAPVHPTIESARRFVRDCASNQHSEHGERG